jgi:prepilin-type N-terminal cleavage/methylation domain-containing protein
MNTRLSKFASTQPSAGNKKRPNAAMRGFSLVELLIVVAITIIITGIGFLTVGPVIQQIHVSNAYNDTLGTLRLARQMAIGKRNIYMVTLSKAAIPNTITITDTDPANPRVIETIPLPSDVSFDNEPGIPNSVATTPDGFGTGANAIDFSQPPANGVGNVIYFYPDGSARDSASNLNNGVVYIALPGQLLSSRAISLWGATGRLRGWRLNKNGAVYVWVQQ